jgi:mono/diheme cytochrome c family protein
VRPGFDVKLVAQGFDYPVNIAFVPHPGSDRDSPVFYVNELHGKIKYVDRQGEVHTYADNLTNFQLVRVDESKSDESGLTGMTLVPNSEDLLVTGAFSDESTGLLKNHILRLRSARGGKRVQSVETVLVLDEFTAFSNQIQQVQVGPDGKLYVSVGDAFNFMLSLDLNRYGGKILRLNLDGSVCADNPFYDSASEGAPRNFVYALGLRNVFDFDFDAAGRCFAADNGKNIDRFFSVVAGGCYGWNGDPESMRVNAMFSWGPDNNTAPVGLEILERNILGDGTSGRCYLALYGPSAATGATVGKAIVELTLDARSGLLTHPPEMLVRYTGSAKGTVLGLAEGPDGLYFTDFWGETTGADDSQGRVYKVVQSNETRGLAVPTDGQFASMSPEDRGHAYFARECASCHRIDGIGGREGPDLTHFVTSVGQRLESIAYEATVNKMIASKSPSVARHRPRLKEVLAAKGAERIKTWLPHHLEEPRFDNSHARMPSFAQSLSANVRSDIVRYLLTRR